MAAVLSSVGKLKWGNYFFFRSKDSTSSPFCSHNRTTSELTPVSLHPFARAGATQPKSSEEPSQINQNNNLLPKLSVSGRVTALDTATTDLKKIVHRRWCRRHRHHRRHLSKSFGRRASIATTMMQHICWKDPVEAIKTSSPSP